MICVSNNTKTEQCNYFKQLVIVCLQVDQGTSLCRFLCDFKLYTEKHVSSDLYSKISFYQFMRMKFIYHMVRHLSLLID